MERSCGCAACATPRDKSSSSPKALCRQERAARLCTCISRSTRRSPSKQEHSALKSGRRRLQCQPGGPLSYPQAFLHRWWNAGDDLLEVSGQAVPAVDLDRYLQAVFAVLNASSNGRPSIFHFAHVLWRHRDTQLILSPPHEPFSGSFSLSFCLSGASWANTGDRVGPVRPSRAPVRRLWTSNVNLHHE